MAKVVEVGKTSDLEPGMCTAVEAAGRWVALCNVDGTFYAMDNTCPHAGGPLGEGVLTGHIIECPWHGWRYDVRTGRRPDNPDFAVERYDVTVEGDAVRVAVPEE